MDTKVRVFYEKPDVRSLSRALRFPPWNLDWPKSHKMAEMMLAGTVEVPEVLRWPGYVARPAGNCKAVSLGTAGISREAGCGDRCSSEPAPIGEALPGVVDDAKKIHAEGQRKIVEKQSRRREELEKTATEVFHPAEDEPGPESDQGPRYEQRARIPPGPPKRGQLKPGERPPPTHRERRNRALKELSGNAYKVHDLLWTWRGAEARGFTPFETDISLAYFLGTDVKVIKRAKEELTVKGWVEFGQYDKHGKNRKAYLVPIRKVPKPGGKPAGGKDG